jgi:Na+/H+ antiporter NhaC
MSSAGAQCNHINHVSTQLPYSLTVAAISFVNFLIAPFIQNVWICLPIAVAMTIATLFVIKLVVNKIKVCVWVFVGWIEFLLIL